MLPRPDNLPLQLTRFVGRQPELAHVRQLVSDEHLVTLTGTGGVGKTRLALEVAASMREAFPDGVWLVELGSLGEASLVAQVVAAALGVRPEALLPLENTVANFLRPRRVLLVLDNCEHLVDACATLSECLLRVCPHLRIVATSREPLRVAGESLWRVPSLAVPPAGAALSSEELLQYGAVRLLVDRASAAGSFSLTEQTVPALARLAQQLDGIPLALELAAARVPALGVVELAGRLDESLRLLVDGGRTAPARHRTLQATIDWSYNLLSEPEKLLLDRLSVFARGFTAEAVEHVADGDGLDVESVLSLLGHLVDRSLVVAEPINDGTIHYRLQEVLRQYGQARLTQRGELDSMRARHAAYFLALVERAEPRVLTNERDRWQDLLELELDNFRASRAWFLNRGDAESLLRLNAYLFLLLAYRGYADEGRVSLLQALAMPGGSQAVRARALHCLAVLAYLQADYRAAAEHGEHSLSLRQQSGDDAELAWSLLERGTTAVAQAEFAVGRPLLQQACDASRRSGQGYVLAYGVALRAQVDYLEGNLRAAREGANEALELGDGFGFVAPTSNALATLGECSYLESDHQAAAVLLQSALDKVKAPGEVLLFSRPILGLALIATDQGDTHRACFLLTEGFALAQRLSNPHRLAQSLERLSVFAAGEGDLTAAWRFLGAASAIRDRLGAPISPTERRILDERLGPSRSRGTAMAALQEGRTWSIERASTLSREFLAERLSSRPSGRERQSPLSPRESGVAVLWQPSPGAETEPAQPGTGPITGAVRSDAGAAMAAGRPAADRVLAQLLTPREGEILRLIAGGKSNKEIAAMLALSVRTVERHITNLYAKVGARGRADATVYALRHRLA